MKLPYSWDLPTQIKNRFGQKSSGRQRAMVQDGHLLLVLHKAPQIGESKREGVFFWRPPNGTWQASEGIGGLDCLTKHFKEYNKAVEKCSEGYDRARDAEDYFQLLEIITPLQLATKNMHATLQAARESIPDDRDLIDFRDWAYEMERTLDILYLNAKNALDFNLAKKTDEQARLSLESVKAANRLNTLAAIFLPLTAISCVFGMNLQNGFEEASSGLFWVVVLLGISLGWFVYQWVVTGKLPRKTNLK